MPTSLVAQLFYPASDLFDAFAYHIERLGQVDFSDLQPLVGQGNLMNLCHVIPILSYHKLSRGLNMMKRDMHILVNLRQRNSTNVFGTSHSAKRKK